MGSNGFGGIYILNADGSAPLRIVDGAADEWGAAWGPASSAAPIDASLSNVFIDKASISADGIETATLTVTLRDSSGSVITDPHDVLVLQNRERGDSIVGPATTTNGVAQFTISSRIAGSNKYIVVIDRSTDNVALAQTAQLKFVDYAPRKAVIFVQGYTSCVTADQEWGLSCGTTEASLEPFGKLKDELSTVGYSGIVSAAHPYSDFIEFSYLGGDIDTDTGNWHGMSYDCKDPQSRSYLSPAIELLTMVAVYQGFHPNTKLYVVGHSFGGVVGFQAMKLSLGGRAPEDVSPLSISGVVTIDSPLNGVKSNWFMGRKDAFTRSVAELFNVEPCLSQFFDTPATKSILSLYGSGKTSAALLANLHAKGAALRLGTEVWNVGNTKDCLWAPSICSPYVGALAKYIVSGRGDYADTQFLGKARNLKGDFPSNCAFNRSGCTLKEAGESHTAILLSGAGTAPTIRRSIAACIIGPQLGSAAQC